MYLMWTSCSSEGQFSFLIFSVVDIDVMVSSVRIDSLDILKIYLMFWIFIVTVVLYLAPCVLILRHFQNLSDIVESFIKLRACLIP